MPADVLPAVATPPCSAVPRPTTCRLPRADARRLEDLLRRVAAAAGARARAGHARCMPSAGWPTTRSTCGADAGRRDGRPAPAARRASTPAGRGPQAADRALAGVVHALRASRARCSTRCSKASRGTPRAAATRRSRTLQDYAARVAGTVGAMMALVMGARSAARAGPRLRPGRGDAAHQHRPRRRRGRPQRPPVPAARSGCARPASTPTPGCARRASTPPSPAWSQRLLRRGRRAVRAAPSRHRRAAARLPPRHPWPRGWSMPRSAQQLERDGLDSVTRRAVVSKRAQAGADRPRRRRRAAPAAAADRRAGIGRGAVPGGCRCRAAAGRRGVPVPAAPPRRSFDERMAVVIGLFERQAAQGRAYR